MPRSTDATIYDQSAFALAEPLEEKRCRTRHRFFIFQKARLLGLAIAQANSGLKMRKRGIKHARAYALSREPFMNCPYTE